MLETKYVLNILFACLVHIVGGFSSQSETVAVFEIFLSGVIPWAKFLHIFSKIFHEFSRGKLLKQSKHVSEIF